MRAAMRAPGPAGLVLRLVLLFVPFVLLPSLLGGCSSLRSGTPPPALYALDSAAPGPPAVASPGRAGGAPTLVVSQPRAAAGYDSQRMIYLRQPHELEYFARSQWVDTPARMLQPLIAAAVERSGRFAAVVPMPLGAIGDFRLDSELIRLQHEFLSRPSRVHLTLRATLTDAATRRVVAWREFDAVVPAASDDPYGGVLAANQAVRELLEQLAAFCAAATADHAGEQPAEPSAEKSAGQSSVAAPGVRP